MPKVSNVHDGRYYLSHSGRLGQRWGVRNGPPYPLNSETVSRAYGGFRVIEPKTRDRAYKNGFALKSDQKQVPIAKDAKLVNPISQGDKNRDNNCGYCAIAYDMRRRGYDVVAADIKSITDEQLLRVYSQSLDARIDANEIAVFSGYKKESVLYTGEPTAERSIEMNEWAQRTLSHQGSGARGLFITHLPDNVGHVMNYEVTNNEIKIVDSQINRIYSISKTMPVCTDVIVIRTDNIEPNYSYIKRKGMVLNA